MTNAEARCNKSLRPRKPEGSLGRTAQDVHLDSHTAPELWYGDGGRGRLYTYRCTVTTRMTSALRWAAMTAILMFHDYEGQSHKKYPETTIFEEKADSNRDPSAYQPNSLLLGQTGSRSEVHSRPNFIICLPPPPPPRPSLSQPLGVTRQELIYQSTRNKRQLEFAGKYEISDSFQRYSKPINYN